MSISLFFQGKITEKYFMKFHLTNSIPALKWLIYRPSTVVRIESVQFALISKILGAKIIFFAPVLSISMNGNPSSEAKLLS